MWFCYVTEFIKGGERGQSLHQLFLIKKKIKFKYNLLNSGYNYLERSKSHNYSD